MKRKIAKRLLRIAKILLSDDGSEVEEIKEIEPQGSRPIKERRQEAATSAGLNGMSNRDAKKFVNWLLEKNTKGYFNDDYWTPIHKTFKELTKHDVDYDLNGSQYRKDSSGNPVSKVWNFEIKFVNNKGRETVLKGRMVASGAGSVDNPLERYDVVAYV